MLDSMLNHDKATGAQNLGQGPVIVPFWEMKSRTITMQGLTIAAITATEKLVLMLEET